MADELGTGLVYGGFSVGVTIAQRLAQTRPGCRGALLMHSCLPVSEFGQSWPQEVPVQTHGKERDEFFDEDLPAARELADSSLDAYDPEAAALLLERVQAFLASV